MRRHFSNRGEALAEATAAKTLASRKPLGKFTSAARSGKRVTAEQWPTQLVEVVAPTRPTKKKEWHVSGKSDLGPPEF
ncbi:MAG TPA: hypothetical protein VEV41_03200 [Terriglobales bacterium]|jgi:DMSO/TMAO reductase YedYZ molybdopterin-dependent catalytic subunit|nr:hypothetical protein [Terriglobales bacterium]